MNRLLGRIRKFFLHFIAVDDMKGDTERAVSKAFARLIRRADGLDRTITFFAETIMADFKELQDRIADLKERVQADETADQALADRLTAQITELQSYKDAHPDIDFQPQIDELQAIADSLVTPPDSGPVV